MSILETLGPNLEVLLSIFCAFVAQVLINFWNTPLPPPPPPLCLTHPLISKFLQPPIIQHFEDSMPPLLTARDQTMITNIGFMFSYHYHT